MLCIKKTRMRATAFNFSVSRCFYDRFSVRECARRADALVSPAPPSHREHCYSMADK